MRENSLRRLTLVVPSYERQEYLLRFIDYWAERGPKIIALDGSARPINSEKILELPNNVQYIHNPIGLHGRLRESLSLIQSDFVMRACDDEFYLPSALEACIDALDKEEDLVACSGTALHFGVASGEVFGRSVYQKLEGYSINSTSAEARVLQHLGDYVPSLIYAVCRTWQWRVSWTYVLQREFPFFASRELQFEMLMAYAGRSRVISELMWLRSENETEPVRGTDSSLDPKKRFPDWWNNPSNRDEHDEFITIMSSAFAALQPYLRGNRRSAIIGGIDSYIDFYFRRHSSKKNEAKIILKGLLLNALPQRIMPYLKNFLVWVGAGRPFLATDIVSAVKVLKDAGIHVDVDALEEVRDIVVTFHASRKLSKS